MKVAVVGGGVMGSAAARQLARRGHDVTIYEPFEVGHKRGSSHGATRIYRYSYPDARYVGMMREAVDLWRDLERDAGESLLTQTGGLDCGPALNDHASALDEHGIVYETLSPAEVKQRWPSLTLPDDALYQAEGGFVRADLAWKAFADQAASAGAATRHERVIALDGNKIRAASGDTNYDVVVVTAGGWARGLLATAGIELATRPTRETVAFFRITETLPTLVDWGDPSVYALADPNIGLKVGEHIAGPTTDPDDAGRVNPGSLERLRDWVTARYATEDPAPRFAETCIYTNTEDSHFVLERHQAIVVGSACSGHGFKFAPLIGKQLADLVEG